MSAGAYQPIFVAIANGAAADVMVRAQKPTLTTFSASAAEAWVRRTQIRAMIVFSHKPPFREAAFTEMALGAAFCDGSQNSTRRRTETSTEFSRRPMTARMKS